MTSGVRSGASGPPESVVRNRTPIPSKPDKQAWVRGLRGEIARVRTKDPELAILLQRMLDTFSDQIDTQWVVNDILDKRYEEFDDDDVIDTEYREIARITQRRERTVTSRDGDVEVDLLDVITLEIHMKGNKTGRRIKFFFKEPLPV